jgi:osmotically-inducible protein OsmY
MSSDTQIQQAVLRELAWDTRVKESHIGVTIDQGVVTLIGTVASYAERLAAQEAAHRVSGVHDVANDLQVQPSGALARTDTEIAHAVRQALAADVLVPDERIQSTVDGGWITLHGTVDRWHERDAAERAVRHLAGVRGVVNRLLVRGPAIAAQEVRSEIMAALERRADRAAKRIAVSVHDGAVTLAGPVRSLAEKEAVLGAARGTPGVHQIHDDLYIDLTTAT